MLKLNSMQAKMILFFLCAQCYSRPTGFVNDNGVNVIHRFNLESQNQLNRMFENDIFGVF